ncbi:Peroxisomal membrane protein PMP22 [Mycena sanguinolenta]|uniref:Peroxisomal membrane protein PMP22 n=1 Tax=Mycena sanguinolenta TaxID=230812 RepID=A0A8H7CKR6_9AGAR|nr:Peroxisomal membrane protein PMP22 [Mycena sanguinolenta]
MLIQLSTGPASHCHLDFDFYLNDFQASPSPNELPPAAGCTPIEDESSNHRHIMLSPRSADYHTHCFTVLGSNIARVPVKRPAPDAPILLQLLARSHIDMRAVKMAIYGFLVSAPISHYLVGMLQKAFAGKTSTGAKIGQIVASNLLVAPVQTVAYLGSMAIISGAKSVDEVLNTIKAGFFSVIRITWISSPIALTIAQKFVPVELWVLYFNAIQVRRIYPFHHCFSLTSTPPRTYFNARVKQLRMAAIKKAEKEKAEEKKD